MGKIRHIIGGNLELLSALHVGTGDTRQAAIRADAGNMTEIAVVACDHRGRPYLPGTTIKGLLRRLAEARLDCLDVVSLFGTIKNETAGSMGALLVRGAAETATGDARGMPYVAVAKLADGIFIAARTRITRDR